VRRQFAVAKASADPPKLAADHRQPAKAGRESVFDDVLVSGSMTNASRVTSVLLVAGSLIAAGR
jgi:hypothetical protein